MIFEEVVKTGVEDVGKNGHITNRAILKILENVGGYHSDKVGYGILDIEKNGVTWVLLDWKVKVLRRPMYGEKLLVKTWGRNPKRITTDRDYQIYNEKKELCVIATSKWALIDVKSQKISKIMQDVIQKYSPEEEFVFEELEMKKVDIPEKFIKTSTFKTTRKDIDLNGHMHNLNYLELAYEMLPEDIYQNETFNNFRISYKKEIKLGDTITCNYTFQNNKHIVVIKNNDVINSIIELWA